MVLKICRLSCLNSWWNILDTVMKRHTVMRMKVNSSKGICTNFSRNVLDGCRNDHDDLPLVYPSMKIPPCQLQELPCLSLFLLLLEFIRGLIESGCTSLLLYNPDLLLYNFLRPSMTLTLDLNSSYVRKAHHFWKSQIICR